MKFEEDVGERVVDELEARQKMYGRILATRWRENAEETLRQKAEERTKEMPGGQSSGLDSIADEFTDPEWDATRKTWVFDVDHPAALIHEVGATEHEIRARESQILAFEWPNAPAEVKEKFSHTEGDLVFFKSVNHPGVPALGYMKEGRRQVVDEVERGATEVDAGEFTLGTSGTSDGGFNLSVGGSE